MKCSKKCIHGGVCKLCYLQNDQKDCDHYSLPAKELVYCADCKYGRTIDKTRSPEKYFRDDCVVCECEDVVGDEPMIYPYFHFCSYGKRKND